MNNRKSQSASRQENKLLEQIVKSCADAKGIDPVGLDVRQISDLTNTFVIISGRSDRHVLGITNRILADLEDHKIKPSAIEGYKKAHWVLLDFDDVIVHVFYEPNRELYDLESLWNQAETIDLNDYLPDNEQAAA